MATRGAQSAPGADSKNTTVLRVHYMRSDGQCQGWELHAWGESVLHHTSWDKPLAATGQISKGCFWDVEVHAGKHQEAGFIVHSGDSKSAGGEMVRVDTFSTRELWLVDGSARPCWSKHEASARLAGSLSTCSAHWVSEDLLLWRQPTSGDGGAHRSFKLHMSMSASLAASNGGVTGSDASFDLEAASAQSKGAEAAFRKFPHLRGTTPLKLSRRLSQGDLDTLVQSQLAMVATDSDRLTRITGVQMAGLLDAEYEWRGPLGCDVSTSGALTLWAPTAQSVSVLVYDEAQGGTAREHELVKVTPGKLGAGAWQCKCPTDWLGKYYLFKIKVYHYATQQLEELYTTDPYSKGLAADGERSLFVDLHDHRLQPTDWTSTSHVTPKLSGPQDVSIYELHVRDFSASDSSCPAELRGKYAAFSEAATGKVTAGQEHLQQLSECGLSHVHLLPSYDFGSVPERAGDQVEPSIDLAAHDSDSTEQQAEISRIAARNAYNWGYDPVHYSVPEGSYASDPDGGARILEYRTMVKALHDMGLRVVQDVVYNHTFASGLDRYSVLDKAVPGYYHRRAEDGSVADSACCNNVATEHRMAERLMIDDLVHWATEYRVDGFRFDIMGHIMLGSMQRAQAALRALTLAEHGVDGASIYVYGEAWDFGEVACNQRGRNASQLNLVGSGLGSFNDRIRDAALGGSPFAPPGLQGVLTGLHTNPNGHTEQPDDARATLEAYTDLVKLSLAGNLREFEIVTADGTTTQGRSVLFNDVPAAYCGQPSENVVYLGCHDNETFYDTVALKANHGGSAAACARIVQMGLGLLAVAQGVPFFHAGDDLLRSKSLDRDSYNSGDWFNKLLWDGSHNNFGVGLPPASKNADMWPLKRQLLGTADLQATPEIIAETKDFMRAVLKLRYSSPLFRLPSSAAVCEQVSFFNQGSEQQLGVLCMLLRSADQVVEADSKQQPDHRSIVAVCNARPDSVDVQVPRDIPRLQLHPLLVQLPHCKGAKVAQDSASLQLAAHTFAVFLEP